MNQPLGHGSELAFTGVPVVYIALVFCVVTVLGLVVLAWRHLAQPHDGPEPWTIVDLFDTDFEPETEQPQVVLAGAGKHH